MSGGNARRGEAPADRVQRFRDSERLLHWAIALPFLLCAASAVVLVLFYNPSPQRPLRGLVSWIHRISGACFLTAPLLVALRHRRDVGTFWGNVREAVRWRPDDVKWLLLQGPASLGRKRELPEVGKFNAGQKLNFMMVMGTWPLLALTGALIWFSDLAFVSWILHFLVAAVALPLATGHMYMALVNPGTRKGLSGMITGYVDRHWLAHHHPRWYRETFGATPAAVPVTRSVSSAAAVSQGVPPAATAPRAIRPPATMPRAIHPSAAVSHRARSAATMPQAIQKVAEPHKAFRPPAANQGPPRPVPGAKVVPFQKSSPPVTPTPLPGDANPMARPARIFCSSCQSEHEVDSWGVLLERFFTASSIPCPGCGVEMLTIQPVLTDPELLEPILRCLEERGSEPAAEGDAPATRIAAVGSRNARSASG